MSCSADYYIVFWSGSADYYVVCIGSTPPHTTWIHEGGATRLRWRGGGSQRRRRNRHYSTLYTGTPYVSSEQLTHKKCAKMYFCKHWQHLLVGATNIGSADYSALTKRYSRNSRR